MKLGILLVVLGCLLIIDGTIRMIFGLVQGELSLIIGGVLTGLLLGGWVEYIGIRRLIKAKADIR